MHVYIYIQIHTDIHIYIYIYVEYTHLHMHMFSHVLSAYTFESVCMHTLYMYINTIDDQREIVQTSAKK